MENLKKIRIELGLRQEDLAEMLSVDRSTVTKWETGKAMPTARNLIELSKIIGCTLDELLQPTTF